MNNEIIVPIDITQEEKAVLAIFSIRQFRLVFPTLIFCGAFLIYINIPFVGMLANWITKLVICIILLAITAFLGFFKFEKYEQYASQFIASKIKFLRSQKKFSHI